MMLLQLCSSEVKVGYLRIINKLKDIHEKLQSFYEQMSDIQADGESNGVFSDKFLVSKMCFWDVCFDHNFLPLSQLVHKVCTKHP